MFISKSTPTEKTFFLSQGEFDSVKEIIEQIYASTKYGIALSGSLVQRMLIPEFARSMTGKPLADVDVVLLGGTIDDCPLLPSIKKHFYVTRIIQSNVAYAVFLIHKKTGKKIDCFSSPYQKDRISVLFGGKEYLADRLGSQSLSVARELISRAVKKSEIRKKWPDKLALLQMHLEKNDAVLEREYQDNKSHLLKKVPDALKDSLASANEYITYAIAISAPLATDSYKRKMIEREPEKDLQSAPGGLTPESDFTLRMIPFYVFMRKVLRFGRNLT